MCRKQTAPWQFINIEPTSDTITTDNGKANDMVDPELLAKLRSATRKCEPFTVELDKLGTFGGARRGVLWLYPRSFREGEEDYIADAASNSNAHEPLVKLQSFLQDEFPFCREQQKVAGEFNPHITISHFCNLDAALRGKEEIEMWWPKSPPVQFEIEEIYLLQRKGDDGQFLRVASIPLGDDNGKDVTLHVPPVPFCHMPAEEEDWVRKERMQLKARRNGRGSKQ
jgi:2'-5' RNA ligase